MDSLGLPYNLVATFPDVSKTDKEKMWLNQTMSYFAEAEEQTIRENVGTSLAIQWLKLRLPVQGVLVDPWSGR